MKWLIPALIIACSTASADVATIVALRGEVYVDSDLVTKQGLMVKEKAVINTEEKSFAVIQFQDGSRVTVRPSSKLIINTFNLEEVEFDLVEGGLRVITGAIAKSNPDNYRVNTKTALLGVRGTEFSIYIVENP